MGRCRVDTCFTFVFFIIGASFFGYSNLLLVYLRLKHQGHVFFGQDARKDNSPSVSIFTETIKNTEKDKVVKLWNKNVQSNKSLAN